MKPFITSQVLSYLTANQSGTYASIAHKYRLNESSVAKAMRKLLDAGMVVGDIRRIENSRATTKDWKITPKGRAADKQNPLGSASKRHGISIKTQAMSEMLWRRREADAQAAAMKRKHGGPVNSNGVEPVELPPTKAGDRITEAPAFFSAMPPGVYALPPTSCAARGS